MIFDDIFDIIGHLGRYQVVLVASLMVATGWPSPVVTIIYSMMALPHWCQVPGLEHLSPEEQRSAAVPWNNETGAYDQCHMYANVTDGGAWNESSQAVVPCDAWHYDHSDYGRSQMEKYDLVCSRKWMNSATHAAFATGMLIGGLVSGYISDRFGRKRTLLASFGLSLVWWVAGILAPNYLLFALFRALVAACRFGFYLSSFLMLMEMVGPRFRLYVGCMSNIGFGCGYMLLSLFAFLLKDGVYLDILCVLPAFFFMLILWFAVHESARWLMVTKRFPEANDVLQNIAKRNRKTLPDDFDTSTILLEKDDSQNNKGKIWQIFLLPNLRKRTFILLFQWATVVFQYYAVTWNSKALIPGNYYVNNFLLALMEVPAAFIAIFLCKFKSFGLRRALSITSIVPGITNLLAVPCLYYDLEVAMIALAMVGKVLVVVSFTLVYVFTSDLYPTEIRQSAFGICAMAGRLSSMGASFVVVFLADLWKPLPYIVIGCLAITAGLLDLLLPETMDKPLCETVEQAENIEL